MSEAHSWRNHFRPLGLLQIVLMLVTSRFLLYASLMDELEQLERSFSNTLDNYWQSMRSQTHLMERSDRVSDDQVLALRAELSVILDSGILSYPQTLQEAGLRPEMSYQDKKKALGLFGKEFSREINETKFLVDMAHKAHEMRKSNWAWRVAEEAEQKQRAKWHPFFVTLTIDPTLCDGEQHYFGEEELPIYDSPQQLWQEGREFRKYIRRLVNVVCEEMGHHPAHKRMVRKGKVIWDYRPESDYVTYAGVIEHGKSREHHHCHLLVWLRAIPSAWRICPNAGIKVPRNRTKNECLPMRTLWPWSTPKLSPALYFRTVGDIWSTEYKFVLPLDKQGQPMKVSVPKVAGLYITKYLSKEHKQWQHRMKATRNLGLVRLKKVIRQLTAEQVRALTWRPKNHNSNHLVKQIHSVPLGLLRSLTKKEHFLNLFRSNQLDLKILMQSNYGVFQQMLQSVQNGLRPDRMDSRDFFDWVGDFLPVPEGFCEKKQFEAHALLQKHFPNQVIKVDHTRIGANNRGHS